MSRLFLAATFGLLWFVSTCPAEEKDPASRVNPDTVFDAAAEPATRAVPPIVIDVPACPPIAPGIGVCVPPTAAMLPHPPAPMDPAFLQAVQCLEHRPAPASRVSHLMEAARHLEAAGYEEEARIYRAQADAITAASTHLLRLKREELSRLQREIAELEELSGQFNLVRLRCGFVEIPANMLEKHGLDLKILLEDGLNATTPSSLEPHSAICGAIPSGYIDVFVQTLKNNAGSDQVQVLFEPDLIATSGREATVRSGGEFPVPEVDEATGETSIGYRQFGITFTVVPTVLGGGMVHLALAPELATPDYSRTVVQHGINVPGLDVRRFKTQLKMEFGHTLVLKFPTPAAERIQPAGHTEDEPASDRAVLIFLTPEPVPVSDAGCAQPAIPQ